ncbi:MAG: acetyl-CoA hydrolase/transferase family protein [Bacteroidales bacterium]|nr:acetyl-CoA hydrolase/transferase family protein [Bacteroidales bacterium]
MNWKNEYRKKVSKPEVAIKAIHDGQCVVMGHAAAAPRLIQQALADHCEDYNDVLIYHMTTLGNNPCYTPRCFGHFRHVSNFLSANSHDVVERREGDFFPAYFKDVPAMIGTDIPCDVAVFQTTPPNAEGYCSLGVSCDYAQAAIHAAKTVIIETNEMMPFTYGDTLIHVSQVAHIIPCAYHLQELQLPKPGEVELSIGRNCATLVADGSTLQLGIGAIPDAVLLSLSDKNDLGIHSEMFSNGVINLIKKGIINGSRKTLHRGKVVVTFIMGSRELYEFVDENPNVEFYPVDYVNNPLVIAKNDRMVSINSCLEVDLQGQVASETIGKRQYSGIGGQVDFIRGASLAREGKAIIAMPSTAAGGKISRIKPFLTEGAAVSTSRNDVDYIVTEYGIARLKGRTLQHRAEDLIRIAHPSFRPLLAEEYEHRFHSPCPSLS